MKDINRCTCGNECTKIQIEFPSGMKIMVPQCLAIAGAMRDPAIVASLKHIDLNIMQDRLAKARRDLEEAEAFWARMGNVPAAAEKPPEVCESCLSMPHKPTCGWAPKPPATKPAPPPAPVPAPEPVAAMDVADEFVEKRGELDAAELDRDILGEPEETAKPEPKLERFLPPKPSRRYEPKACCGSLGPRHKSGCEGKLPPDDVPKIPSGTPKDAEVETEEAEDEEKEDQEFVCKECGNTRMEPHGTKALLLECPNSWDGDPSGHIYELKADD